MMNTINLEFKYPYWVYINCDFDLMQQIKTFVGCQYSLKDKLWRFNICFINVFIKYIYNLNPDLKIHCTSELSKQYELYNNNIDINELLKDKQYNVNQNTYFKKNNNYSLTNSQLQGAYWLSSVKKGILAFDVGVGKTYASLEAAHIVNNNGSKKLLIITLASLINQWKSEIEKQYDLKCFSIKEFKKQKFDNNFNVISEKICTPNSEQRKLIYRQFKDSNVFSALIINYELVRIDFNELKNINFDIAIIDEASKVKATSSFNTTNKVRRLNNRGSVRELLKNTDYIFALTATPFETFLTNLYGIFNVINPDYFSGGYSRFVNRYMKQDYFGSWSIINKLNFEEIKKLVKPYMFFKKQELDIKININKINLEFSNEDLLLYDKIIENTTLEINNKFKKHYNETEEDFFNRKRDAIILSAVNKRYQFVDFPQIVYPEKYDNNYVSPKAKWLLDNILKMEGKTIIFDSRTMSTDIICKIFNDNNIKYFIIDGKISLKDRNIILERFKNEDDVKILICSDCLSYGVNLQNASNLINLNLLYNPSAMQQRQGRVIRKGQKNDVNIYFLEMKNTFEEKIYEKLDYRSQIASDIFDDDFLKNKRKNSINKNKMLEMILEKSRRNK